MNKNNAKFDSKMVEKEEITVVEYPFTMTDKFEPVSGMFLNMLDFLGNSIISVFSLFSVCRKSRIVPPGPKGHFLLGLYPEYKKFGMDILCRKLWNDYSRKGGICRFRILNRVYYLVTSPELVKEVFHNNEDFIKGASWDGFRTFTGRTITSIEVPDEESRQESVLLSGFLRKESIMQYERQLVKISSAHVDSLEGISELDMLGVKTYVAESTSTMLFDGEFRLNPNLLVNAFDTIMERMEDEFFKLLPIPTKLWLKLPTKKNRIYRNALRKVESSIATQVTQLLSTMNKKDNIESNSYLSALIKNHWEELKRNEFSKEFVDKMILFTFAGHDGTSRLIIYTIYLIAKNPEIQKSIYLDLDQYDETDQLSLNSVMKCETLKGAIMETLRLLPITPQMTKDIAGNRTYLGKFLLDKNSAVISHIGFVHVDENEWKNSGSANISRFSNLNIHGVTPYSFIPFGTGSRICPGRLLAFNQAMLFLFMLYRKYEVHCNEVSFIQKMFLVPDQPIKVSLCPRANKKS